MTDPTQATAPTEADAGTQAPTGGAAESQLVEEVSIDGMCGVY